MVPFAILRSTDADAARLPGPRPRAQEPFPVRRAVSEIGRKFLNVAGRRRYLRFRKRSCRGKRRPKTSDPSNLADPLLSRLQSGALCYTASSRKAPATTTSTDLGRKDHDPRSRGGPRQTRRGRARLKSPGSPLRLDKARRRTKPNGRAPIAVLPTRVATMPGQRGGEQKHPSKTPRRTATGCPTSPLAALGAGPALGRRTRPRMPRPGCRPKDDCRGR